ncbi:MAG: type II CAAX prenyl endopeptidase Rce1 family protein [Candidatus Hodarchaeota archaeon]
MRSEVISTPSPSSKSKLSQQWEHVPVLIKAIIVGFLVNVIGVYGWVLVVTIVPAPWSILLMGILLWTYWKYFSGDWWSKPSVEARKRRIRSTKLQKDIWKLSLAAIILFVIVGQSALLVTFRIIEFPSELFTIYSSDGVPVWLMIMFVAMMALVAGICEETGFRGYMQVPIEEEYGPVAGIIVVSIIFLLSHLHQSWILPVLLHTFALSALLGLLAYNSKSLIPGIIAHTAMDVFNFGFWWSDFLGTFEMAPVGITGIDLHFVSWLAIMVASTVAFLWVSQRVAVVRKESGKLE